MAKNFSALNYEIKYREWPADNPKASLILVHGMGGYSGRFEEFGEFLRNNGFNAYAIDLPGFGESSGMRGDIEDLKIYPDVLKMLIAHLKEQNRELPFFMVGESMGGLIVFDYAIRFQSDLQGIIIISPAIKGKNTFSILTQLTWCFALLFQPFKYFAYSFTAPMFTRDAAVGAKIDRDSLEVRSFTARFYFNLLKTMLFVGSNARKVNLPVLMLQADADKMIVKDAAINYFNKITSKDKTLKVYKDAYHALYLDTIRSEVFNDILNWLSERLN